METVESAVDTVNHKITSKLNLFSIYAVIGNLVTATVVEKKSPLAGTTLAAVSSPTPSPENTTANEMGTNWIIFGGIGGGAIIGLIVGLLLWRRYHREKPRFTIFSDSHSTVTLTTKPE